MFQALLEDVAVLVLQQGSKAVVDQTAQGV